MAIIRSKQKSRGFYMLERSLSDDQRISWAAKGMLVFLLAKPDEWTVCVEALVNFTKPSARPVGKDGVYAILKELVEAGYVERVKHASGQLDYVVYDEPQIGKIPNREKPDRENPNLDNPPLGNTDFEVKNDSVGKKKGFDALTVELPSWMPAAPWAEWVASRKQMKKPLTELAAKKCIKTLTECYLGGGDPVAIIDASIASGWTGLFLPKTATKTVGKQSRFTLESKNYGDTTDPNIPF